MDKISVFVFESGSIIITGAKHADHISKAYKYITTKIYENYNKIIINNLDTILKKYNIISLKNKSNEDQNIPSGTVNSSDPVETMELFI